MITEKRFKVAVYDDKAINGFAVLDLQKPNSSKRLKYENVYIGSKVGCEIVCNFGNSLADENRQLKSTIAQLIEQNRKNNDLLLSDIRILEKALWCGGCENDYGRLKELRKEFMKWCGMTENKRFELAYEKGNI